MVRALVGFAGAGQAFAGRAGGWAGAGRAGTGRAGDLVRASEQKMLIGFPEPGLTGPGQAGPENQSTFCSLVRTGFSGPA
ncbi:hypothetical protein TIFTF001_052808 [Ficus carica]|uniref:Uncharacterized protein n=1 Tax=Ficus carica TaxID=3494 RepID=A0AA88ECG7_FICCA|nr:hypothetical protein TIFTF001_052808 [Ficus carica]